MLLVTIFTTSVSAIKMYAPDGRTAKVADVDVKSWKAVGWYEYPVTTVYSRDGRKAIISKDAVDSWVKVGWYKNPKVTMYAPDGRTANVYLWDVNAWKKVGWFESQKEAVKSKIVGNWSYIVTDELMEHHSVYVSFNADGTFYASTWRCEYYGTYTISGNSIKVNYDLYFMGAGEKTHSYYYSDVWNFDITGNRLYSDGNYYVKY